MKKIYTSILALGLLIGSVGVASATLITNGGFESGVNGWDVTGTGVFSAVTSQVAAGGTQPPNGGSNMGSLSATSTIGQFIQWEVGYTLSFDWSFLSNDYMYDSIMPRSAGDDTASFSLTNTSISQVLTSISFLESQGGVYNSTDWATYRYTFENAGSGYLSFSSTNGLDNFNDSYLLLDNIQVVPEPGTMLLLGTGLMGLVAIRRRKSRE